MANKQANIRLSQTDLDILDTLRSMAGMTRSKYMSALLWAEWDKLEGNPRAKAAAEQLLRMREELNALTAALQGDPSSDE